MDPFKNGLAKQEKENKNIGDVMKSFTNTSPKQAQDGVKKEKAIKSTPETDNGQNKAKNDVVHLHYEISQYKPTKDDKKMIPFRLNSDGAKLIKAIAQKKGITINDLLVHALETHIREFYTDNDINEIKRFIDIK